MGNNLPSWHTQHIARTVLFFATTISTQSEARHLIDRGEADGALVMAREQSAGRGRLGRAWHSPAGNLYLSFILKPSLPLVDWPQYTMMAALALTDAIESVLALPIRLKWPNDLLLSGRKVAGILAEVVTDYLILGVGVNVIADLPAALSNATSLERWTSHPIDTARLLQVFVERFDQYYDEALHGIRFERRWAQRLQTLGQPVRVRSGAQVIDGLAEGVDATGALLVRRADGSLEVCRAGEVTLSV